MRPLVSLVANRRQKLRSTERISDTGLQAIISDRAEPVSVNRATAGTLWNNAWYMCTQQAPTEVRRRQAGTCSAAGFVYRGTESEVDDVTPGFVAWRDAGTHHDSGPKPLGLPVQWPPIDCYGLSLGLRPDSR